MGDTPIRFQAQYVRCSSFLEVHVRQLQKVNHRPSFIDLLSTVQVAHSLSTSNRSMQPSNSMNQVAIQQLHPAVRFFPSTPLDLALHTIIRNKHCKRGAFVRGLNKLLIHLCEFAACSLPSESCSIITPTNATFDGLRLKHVDLIGQSDDDDEDANALIAVTIVRAGEAFESALRSVFGEGLRIGKLLVQRRDIDNNESSNESTTTSINNTTKLQVEARTIWSKLPPISVDSPPECVFLCDVMLATGSSLIVAIEQLIEANIRIESIIVLVLLAVNEGISHVCERWPNLRIIVGFLDEHLNEHAYIVPGLGDAGDRMFSH